jgi:hypothetical protein
MSRDTTTIEKDSSVSLSREALEALGVEVGSELQVEIVGRALVVRSKTESQRSRDFMNAFDSILTRRQSAYEELAKGPSE